MTVRGPLVASAALLLLLLHLACTWPLGSRHPVPAPAACRLGVRVALVVSSDAATDGTTRLLEVRWEDASPLPGDFVAVFEADPAISQTEPLFTVAPQSADGSARTDVLSKVPDDDIGFTEQCYGHWVGYLRPANDSESPPQLLASSCIRTRPTWMHDLAPQIGQKRLRDLFIPGTHDSGSFAEGTGDRITKYTYTQEESVFQQLIFGCRYLDIRVGYYPPSLPRRLPNGTMYPERPTSGDDKDVFWLNHGVIRIRPLQEVIDMVKRFVAATQEVVIFDVQEFPVGFTSLDIHVRLMAYLGREFDGMAANVSTGWDAPLNTFWKEDRRLIIGYDNSEAREKAEEIAEAEGKGRGGSLIWRAVVQKWGNVRTVSDLRNYLSGALAAPPSGAWAAMAELTPNAWDVITDGPGGLRKMANAVNGNVSTWFAGTWGHLANVVATDYFRANEVVEGAIAWNFRRAVWSTDCRHL
ncbi:uncharacterized protein LOC124154421 [Ischnura elegans]|uniref:uncharacterized protein LOC124154421 n=1 Tax=Ischnura elegans TaxID=197161 RepID=UPI001ED8BB6D|nr:uncharacterized protein LOC124154421 [Ischnura elegans]